MYLRFRILSPTNAGAPNYELQGQPEVSVPFANLSLYLKIKGTDVINTSDLSSYIGVTDGVFQLSINNGGAGYNVGDVINLVGGTGIGLQVTVTTVNAGVVTGVNVTNIGAGYVVGDFVIDGGGLIIEVNSLLSTQIENIEYIKVEIPIDDIWEVEACDISISKTNYTSFNGQFFIDKTDLGINPNIPISNTNTPLNFYLIKLDDFPSSIQTSPFASFNYQRLHNAAQTFYSPLIYIAKSNNGLGSNQIINDSGTILSNIGNLIINDYEEVIVKMTSVIGSNTVETGLTTIAKKIVYLDFETTIGNVTNPSSDCYSVDDVLGCVTTIDYSLLSSFNINDTVSNPIDTQRIKYTLYDYAGSVIATFTNDWSTPYGFVFNIADTQYSTVIGVIGDITLKTELLVVGNDSLADEQWVFSKTYTLQGCNWYEVKRTDCSTYTVYNRSSSSIDLVLYQLQEDKTWLEISTTTITAYQNTTISHNEDGVYKYDVTRNGVTYSYIVINDCNLETCNLNYINALICKGGKKCKCSDCDCREVDFYNFNAFVTMRNTYYQMLNAEYNFNFLYTNINNDKLNQLYDIKRVLDKAAEYCVDCETPCTDC